MNLFEQINLNSVSDTPLLRKRGHFVVDDTIGVALATASSFIQDNGKYLLICSNLYKAQRIYNLISSFVGKEYVMLFPCDELIRAEAMAQSKEMMAHRLYVLNEVIHDRNKIIVTNVAACCRYLPDPEIFQSKTFEFEVGKCYDIIEIRKNLIKAGYSLVNKIDQSLQFAVRGDILDIYSVNNDYPIRIEFFGDEIESIRYFDLATQTSISKIQNAIILPASDIILSEGEINNATEKLFSLLEKDQQFLSSDAFLNLRGNIENDSADILEGNISEKIYKYYAYLTGRHFSLLDYCKNYLKVLVDKEAISNSNNLLIDESLTYLSELNVEGKILSHQEMYQNLFTLINLSSFNVCYSSSLVSDGTQYVYNIKNVPFQASRSSDSLNIIQTYLNEEYTIVLSLSSKEHLNTLQESLSNFGVAYEMVHDFDLPKSCKVGFTLSNLGFGFVLPDLKIVYLTSSELFNEKVRTARFDNRFKEATIIKNFEDLQPGDYVVHEYQGIGQYLGLETLEVDGVHKDYLKIAYFGNETLYVPLAQFQLVRKYLGKEGMSPRLSHLHSKDWENTKARVKARVNDLAERLMRLYVERSKVKGFAFQEDDEFQNDFENAFPYPLTSDQSKALSDIKKDMEKDFPMDRLLCGDVGFGKTEVAFRAAFKAILSGKQVALLCPTTLLARQHYELALKRFAGFDVRIAVFSRLIPESKQKEYLEDIRNGSIHLTIGTHRILSKDMQFKNLGLLIIDEEQRFGVEQKEKLKELKSNIDVLTLSATPIPRTLQISLLGVRSMSKIDTPPQDRMPIQTYVTPFKMDVVKELIERELGRNGQVFFLHNNISTLYMRVNHLQKLMPSVRFGVAHGRMERNDIEDVMMNFYKGEIDVLVCTSIVENGIDVPNANMIIVEDSENYGLSQLYQIKGRVGRSNRIAYAYLMYSEHKQLNEKATKRLKALQDFTELGSGYKIAQRDLMIRGAGDILGPEQAGFIDSIGLDMYIKLLNEAVKEKMEGVKEETKVEANTTLAIEAYIPSSFANDSDKIELYQEILYASTVESLSNLKVKTRDIFGKLPKEVETLFAKRNIDLLIKEASIEKVQEKPKFIEMYLGKDYINIRGIGNILFEALIPFLTFIKITYANNLFKIQLTKGNEWLKDLETVLKSLKNVYEHNKVMEIV